jgi:NitT/TauT family transport system ATP-binding protein
LARALAMESQVLLMDEPFSSLDKESKEGAIQLLKKLWKERGFTVVFVTHDVEEAKALSHKIIYFEDINGKVQV